MTILHYYSRLLTEIPGADEHSRLDVVRLSHIGLGVAGTGKRHADAVDVIAHDGKVQRGSLLRVGHHSGSMVNPHIVVANTAFEASYVCHVFGVVCSVGFGGSEVVEV